LLNATYFDFVHESGAQASRTLSYTVPKRLVGCGSRTCELVPIYSYFIP
jgi:hypothetical protein